MIPRTIGLVLLAAGCTSPTVALPAGEGDTGRATTSGGGPTPSSLATTSAASTTEAESPSGSTAGHGTSSGESSTGTPMDDLEVPLAYLRPDPYARLVLEIDFAGGLEPYPPTLAQIGPVLDQLVDKPGGVEVVMDDVLIPVGSDHAWTAAERVALGEARFDLELPVDTIAIHVMMVDGYPIEDDASSTVTLGHAWGNRHVMVYKETIAAGCEGAVVGELTQLLCERTELLLLQHELGHVLGLVDFGIPMQKDHRDPDLEHGPHDVDPECLMHWRFETLDLLDSVLDELVTGAPPIQLGPACLQDLAAAQQ